MAYENSKIELHHNTLIAVLMLFFGVCSFVAMWFATTFGDNFYLVSLTEVMAWVFTWEAVDAYFLQRHKIRNQCILLRKLTFADVKICSDGKIPTKRIFIK